MKIIKVIFIWIHLRINRDNNNDNNDYDKNNDM